MKWFGESWGAYVNRSVEQMPVPEGQCIYCNKPIAPSDSGFELPFVPEHPVAGARALYHKECFFETLGISKLVKRRCDECDPSFGCFDGSSPCSKQPPSEGQYPRCPECGAQVVLTAKPGRMREILKGVLVAVPANFLIPTCVQCGEESMTAEISAVLDPILLAKANREKGPNFVTICAYGIDTGEEPPGS